MYQLPSRRPINVYDEQQHDTHSDGLTFIGVAITMIVRYETLDAAFRIDIRKQPKGLRCNNWVRGGFLTQADRYSGRTFLAISTAFYSSNIKC